MNTIAAAFPQWSRVQDAFLHHINSRWLTMSASNKFNTLSTLVQTEMPEISLDERESIVESMRSLAEAMELNAHYLAQKIATAPVGHFSVPPGAAATDTNTNAVLPQLLSTLSVLSEAAWNANAQIEQVARFGFSASFEERGGSEHSPATTIVLAIMDHKGRAFDLASFPAGTAITGKLQAFNRKDTLICDHVIHAQVPEWSAATSIARGELAQFVLNTLKEPFVLLKAHDLPPSLRSMAKLQTIEKLNDVMFSAYSTIEHAKVQGKKLTVIPFRSSHRSVIAQLNKLNPHFSKTISFAVQEGITTPELQIRAQHVSDESKKRSFSPETEGTDIADMQRLAINSFVEPHNKAGHLALLSYMGKMLSGSEPSQEMERKAWQAMLSGKVISGEHAWHIQRGLFRAGAVLNSQLPPADFKYQPVTLHRLSTPDQTKEKAKVPAVSKRESGTKEAAGSSYGNNTPAEPRQPKSHKTPSLARLPGNRDDHFKTIESVLSDHTVAADNVSRNVIDAIQPGLYPHFVMHRVESMNLLVRSIRTSQDADFVRTGISMILRSIEAQWRELPDHTNLAAPTILTENKPVRPESPSNSNTWRSRPR